MSNEYTPSFWACKAWINQETDDWGTGDPPLSVWLSEKALLDLMEGGLRAKHLEEGVDFVYAEEVE